jgi:hypothetical protein
MRLPMLAGWLFADLMLMLFLVGLSMAPAAPKRPPPPPRTPNGRTPSPHATASPKGPRVVDPHRYPTRVVAVNLAALASGGDNGPAARTLRAHTDTMLRHLVRDHPELRGREVGVALIFGAGPQSGIGTAERRAGKVGDVLRDTDDSFRHAVVEPLWTEGSPDFVKMRLYFYSN